MAFKNFKPKDTNKFKYKAEKITFFDLKKKRLPLCVFFNKNNKT